MAREISEAVLAAQGTDEHSDAVLALELTAPPTNQQIIDAAKRAYQHYQPAVDAATEALVNIINSGSLLSEVTALDGVNWQSPGITDSVVESFYSSKEV